MNDMFLTTFLLLYWRLNLAVLLLLFTYKCIKTINISSVT